MKVIIISDLVMLCFSLHYLVSLWFDHYVTELRVPIETGAQIVIFLFALKIICYLVSLTLLSEYAITKNINLEKNLLLFPYANIPRCIIDDLTGITTSSIGLIFRKLHIQNNVWLGYHHTKLSLQIVDRPLSMQ